MGLLAWFRKTVCNKRIKENKPKKAEAKKSLNFIKDDALTKQASTALNRIHFWSKIQSELRTRRLYMVTESRIKQKKLQNQLKIDSKLHELEVKWCCEPGSKDEVVSKIHQRGEATNRRERALAYAFSHQQRKLWMELDGAMDCGLPVGGSCCVPTHRLDSVNSGSANKKQGKKIKHVKTKMLVTLKPKKGTKQGPNKASNGTS